MVNLGDTAGRHSARDFVRPPVPRPGESSAIRDLSVDLPVRRVLWMLSHGMVWPWLVRDMCDADAVDRAIGRGLVDPPENDDLPFHLTDLGRANLLQWYEVVAPEREKPDYTALWRAVTFR